ncbi:hypothetical protein DLH72_01185 [Candidatus Gracilibacteria bacterium]|nr:MAG: hypothetical protein DLH72_01185 [Candidatus Gracilibacteria bacterium]
MFKINSDIIRSSYIGFELKKIIEKSGKTITSVAENMGISQPALSRVLNGKVGGSDNFFMKVGNAIPITETEIKKIFKEADKKEFEYKYGEELGMKSLIIEDNGQEPITTVEEAEKVLFKMNGIKPTEEALRSVRLAIDMIKFDQNKNK